MDFNKIDELVLKAYEDYSKTDPNVKRYMLLSNGQKFYVVEIESLNSEILKLSGFLKINDNETGIETQLVIHVSQLNIIFEKF